MEQNNAEIQDLIPGTNIPRPRERQTTESDQDYVNYLKEYYEKYFPNNVSDLNQKAVQENIDTVEEFVDEVSPEELDTIQNEIEQFADGIINENVVDEVNNFSFDVTPDTLDSNQEIDSSQNDGLDDIFFNVEPDEEETVVNYSETNEVLTNKIRTPEFFKKVTTFFKNTKEKVIGLRNKSMEMSNKFSEYFEDINFSFEDEPTPNLGRSR